MRTSRAGWVVASVAVVVTVTTAVWAGTFELHADVVTTDSQTQAISARGRVRLTHGAAVVRAERVVYTPKTGRLILSGDVTIATPDGALQAREATLLFGQGGLLASVDATGVVQVRARQRTLNAEHVVYVTSIETLVAMGSVKLVVPPDVVISGGELVATSSRGVATLTGRPRLQNADAVIEGDRLEVVERTQTATFHDHVVASIRANRLTADSATLENSTQKAIFRGRVTITGAGRTMTTDQVTVYYRQGRMVAEGTTSMYVEEERP